MPRPMPKEAPAGVVEPAQRLLSPSWRPKPYEPETVRRLAAMGFTLSDVSRFYGRSDPAFSQAMRQPGGEALMEAYQKGSAEMRMSLRMLQLKHASMPGPDGVKMTIHMSRYQLGEHEELRVGGTTDGKPVEFTFNFTRAGSASDGG